MAVPSTHTPQQSARSLEDLQLPPKKFLLATDTCLPTINGVSLSLDELARELRRRGHTVQLLTPRRTLFNPLYPDIPIPLPDGRHIERFIKDYRPDHIHIASEFTVGLQVRGVCLNMGYQFTTSFHTMWPAFLKRYLSVPEQISWHFLRAFHNRSSATMTRSPSLVEELSEHGFLRLHDWPGSVDTDHFSPGPKLNRTLRRPILLYVGRVAVEKNLEEFLRLEVRGTKVVVGDGPARSKLERRHPDAQFVGMKRGNELRQWFREGDVFVFPSTTDTFGRVMIEALACGIPVAALPVTGAKDIVTAPGLGALSSDLREAIEIALVTGDPEACVARASDFSVPRTTDRFLTHVQPSGMESSYQISVQGS